MCSPVSEIALLCALVQQRTLGKRLYIFEDIVIRKNYVTDVDRGSKYEKTRCHQKQHGGELRVLAVLTCGIMKKCGLFC